VQIKRSGEDEMTQEKISDPSELSEEKSFKELTRQTSGSETETSKSFLNHIKVQKTLRTRRRLNKSESASNNSHKSQHLPTTSSHSSGIRSPHEYSSDSTNNYYLSSRGSTSSSSQISSKRSRKDRSGIIASKTYEDRACSPIKIKSSRQTNQMINNQRETEDDDDVDIPETSSSSKTEMNHHISQVSIISIDKGLQYPSETEQEESITSGRNVSYLKVYDLDKALHQIHSDFKGNTIMFDNEDELLDISDRKKDDSSRNSSYNSIPSADRSSICSISSYEPSERFYRRTRAEDDDDNFTGDADDSEPMTYRKHVALLAERAFRTCTNYYNESIKRIPDLDQELNEKVQMLYNSEMRFNTLERQKKEEDLIKEFNKRLLHQFNRIAPRIQ